MNILNYLLSMVYNSQYRITADRGLYMNYILYYAIPKFRFNKMNRLPVRFPFGVM